MQSMESKEQDMQESEGSYMQDGSCFSVDPVMPLKEVYALQLHAVVSLHCSHVCWSYLDSFTCLGSCWLPAKPGCPQLERHQSIRANRVTWQSVDTGQVKNGVIFVTDHRYCQWAISILQNCKGINILCIQDKIYGNIIQMFFLLKCLILL